MSTFLYPFPPFNTDLSASIKLHEDYSLASSVILFQHHSKPECTFNAWSLSYSWSSTFLSTTPNFCYLKIISYIFSSIFLLINLSFYLFFIWSSIFSNNILFSLIISFHFTDVQHFVLSWQRNVVNKRFALHWIYIFRLLTLSNAPFTSKYYR